MVYRLLALDVDGTILRSNQRLDRETKDAVDYVKRKGVYVTLATRRHFSSAKKLAKALKLDTILITHNGAFVANVIDNPWLERKLSAEEVGGITRLLEAFDCHIRIKHERFSVANRIRQNQSMIAKLTIGDPLFYPVSFVDELSEYLHDAPVSAPQIEVFFKDELQCRTAKEQLLSRFPEVNINIYEPNRMEIVARGVSKAEALLRLGERLDISPEEMVAVGDSYADMEMIAQVGLGVAMGHAPKEVKAQAKWVTRSNDQHGVSYMVKEVFRKQLRMQIRSIRSL